MPRIVSTLLTLTLVTCAGAQQSPLQPVTRLAGHPDWVSGLAFSPNGEALYVGGYDFLFHYDTANWEKTPMATGVGEVGAVAISADGRRLALAGYQEVRVYPVLEDGLIGMATRLKGHRGLVTDAVFTPNGQLITASDDATVRIWDSEKTVRTLTVGEPVQAIALHGSRLATASGDVDRPTRAGNIRLWDVTTGESLEAFPTHARAATDVGFMTSGQLISTGLDEVARLHPTAGEQPVGTFTGHARPVQGVVCLNNNLAATISGGGASGRNELHLWRTTDREKLAAVEPHTKPITSIARTANREMLATGSHDKTVAVFSVPPAKSTAKDVIRIGMIGLDTSHCGAFTRVLNDELAEDDVAGCKVVCAYPFGSRSIESSASRIPKYTDDMKKLGVEITESVDELLGKVDAVLLETNDGRLHLEQYLACAKAGKPVFIDKPVAAHLDDVIAIYEISRRYGTPMFSSSSLRYSTGALEVRGGSIGNVLGCSTYGPCSFEKTHSDLYWYGIHGCELLYTVMGTGCVTVSRKSTATAELVTGEWEGGRVGTFRGIRAGKTGYGGTAFGHKGIRQTDGYGGYRPLVVDIVAFFKSRKVPIDPRETIELYAFMSAAEQSAKQNGAAVSIASVMEAATASANRKLKELGVPEQK